MEAEIQQKRILQRFLSVPGWHQGRNTVKNVIQYPMDGQLPAS